MLPSPAPVLVAEGSVSVDGKPIYQCKDLKVGIFDLPFAYP
jgi:hypothetical protein